MRCKIKLSGSLSQGEEKRNGPGRGLAKDRNVRSATRALPCKQGVFTSTRISCALFVFLRAFIRESGKCCSLYQKSTSERKHRKALFLVCELFFYLSQTVNNNIEDHSPWKSSLHRVLAFMDKAKVETTSNWFHQWFCLVFVLLLNYAITWESRTTSSCISRNFLYPRATFSFVPTIWHAWSISNVVPFSGSKRLCALAYTFAHVWCTSTPGSNDVHLHTQVFGVLQIWIRVESHLSFRGQEPHADMYQCPYTAPSKHCVNHSEFFTIQQNAKALSWKQTWVSRFDSLLSFMAVIAIRKHFHCNQNHM